MDPFGFYEYLISRGFERRRSQERMIGIVREVVEEGGVKLIEAPTGTGKTFGYLIPIITGGVRAVISTGTKILQDQLRRDLEFLISHYKMLTGREVRYAVVKGRANYLCLDRFFKEKPEDPGNVPELMEGDWDGDLTLSEVPPHLVGRINVDEDYCTPSYREVCPYRGRCYYWSGVKVREASADILVVNHALLALKEFEDTKERVLVVDEAHELDRYLTLATTVGISLYTVRETVAHLERIGGDRVEVEVEDFFRENFSGLFEKDEEKEVPLDSLQPYAEPFRKVVLEPLRLGLRKVKEKLKEEVGNFLRSRLAVSHRLKFYLERVPLVERDLLEVTNSAYEDPDEEEREILEKVKRLEFLERKVSRIGLLLRIWEESPPEYGFKVSRSWSRRLQTFNYRLEVFPVFPRDVVNPEDFKGVVLTSATVDPEDIAQTTGITGDFYRLSHNFSYSGVTFIVENTNPKKADWEERVREAYRRLRSLHERVMVLMTNREHLKLIEGGPEVGFQGEGSFSRLIEAFREGKVKVLVGLDSLWTGVDVKGHKGILMSKLPFESPEDPVTYHRIRFLKETGQDPFLYQRRKAFIKFRQGVGRLVRREGDGGTIVLCDNRIYRYREFLDFLHGLGVRLVRNGSLTDRRTWGRPYLRL
jgi:ATP-dependent DNA helicase DinG